MSFLRPMPSHEETKNDTSHACRLDDRKLIYDTKSYSHSVGQQVKFKTHTSIHSSGRREPPASASVKVWSSSVDEGCLLSRLVLCATRVAELRAETREEACLLSRLRFLQSVSKEAHKINKILILVNI